MSCPPCNHNCDQGRTCPARDIDPYTTPPQRTWVGLTKEDMPDGKNPMFGHEYFIAGMVFAAKVLEEKNT